VPEREAARAERGLELGTERAGQHVDREALVVHRRHPGHRGEIEQHTAEAGHAGPAHAAAPTGHGHRDPMVVASADDGGNFTRIGGSADCSGHRRDLAGPRPVHRQRPPIAAGLGAGAGLVRGIGADTLERRDERRIQGRRVTEAAAYSIRRTLERDGRRRRAHASGSE
jgi:hypothetical protein